MATESSSNSNSSSSSSGSTDLFIDGSSSSSSSGVAVGTSSDTSSSGSSEWFPSSFSDGSSSNGSMSSNSSSGTINYGTNEPIGSGSLSSDSALGAGSIIGIILGGLTFGGLLFAIFVCRRRRRSSRPSLSKAMLTPETFVAVPIQLQQDQPNVWASPTSASDPVPGLWNDPVIIIARIPHEKVLVETPISQGGFGEVYRGKYKGKAVAIKTLLPAIRKDMKHINSFLEEAKIMASIEHERVVQFVGVAWDSLRDLCVVTEFMDGGDLRSLLTQFDLQKVKTPGFDADKQKIATHVAHALVYLHSLQPIVVHRDLKSRNILLDAEWNAKLTDFGVSRESTDQTMTAGVGTTLWMAPEVMMGERYNEKADIFSFGVVLSELDSHQLPYASAKHTDSGRTLPDTAILQLVAMGRLQAQFSEAAPVWMKELGHACLSVYPEKRPSASDVLYALQTHHINKSW